MPSAWPTFLSMGCVENDLWCLSSGVSRRQRCIRRNWFANCLRARAYSSVLT